MKKLIGLILLMPICYANAGEIGHGTILAIKQYDFTANKSIKIYLSSDAAKQNPDCSEAGYTRGTITIGSHDETAINRMLSMAMAAHMGGKKVRLYSENSACEVDFISVQEVYF